MKLAVRNKMSDKIECLLRKAEAQEQSSSPEQSSVTSAGRNFLTNEEAEAAFSRLEEKLFRIKNWNDASGASSYELFDANGDNRLDNAMTIGDFIRISLKGALKYDWVKIIEIYRSSNEIVLTVQPTFNPTEDNTNESVTSHFFNDQATNNFCLEKTDKSLKFYVIGLNEKTNTLETKGLLETIRNLATANIGSYLGIQKGEWKTFCEQFLEIENQK